MLRREFKVNFKSFIIWLIVLLAIFLLVYLMYPYIINIEYVAILNEMMEVFPKEM